MYKPAGREKISVYMSTYNRITKLERAINSVLAQDYDNWELLVCDDASNDGTDQFMNELLLKDKRIKYFRNNENKGACITRNIAIKNASGKFITGLDDDDEFTSNRLSLFLSKWDEKYSFICCNFINKYNDGNEKKYYKNEQEKVFSYHDILFENEASNQIFTLTDRLKNIGGFNRDVKRLQDWDTWLRLSYRFGNFLRINDATYIMHHDHLISEPRVSENIKITEALLLLAKRNVEIYKKNDVRFMRYIVDSMNKETRFSESLYWALKHKNIKYLIKYFLQ